MVRLSIRNFMGDNATLSFISQPRSNFLRPTTIAGTSDEDKALM